ncbi:AraC family transcriptional regulator [Marinobacter sp. R17]|uniref:AraC family transcriptional regulator n=1 Tax=Marinobacter sp. R17 TaxID=2484250 RepID=UPI001CC214E0|nr:AraC family transcriptional regulator [Marinobacter sp. R17]
MTANTLLTQTKEQMAALPAWARQRTQASTYPRAFLDVANAYGVAREDLLALAGVSAERVDDPGGKVSLQDVWCIAAAVVVLTGDESLGFATGDRMPLTAHGSLGYALLCAGTPREAIRILERFWHLRGRGALLSVEERDDGGFLELMPEFAVPARINQVMFSSMLTSVYRGMAFLLPGMPVTVSIWLRGPQPAGFERWQSRLPEVRFNMPRAGLSLLGDTRVLDRPQPTADPEALSAALLQCERESALSEEADNTLRSTRAALVPGLAGYPSPEDLAETLHLTPRTLRRRLHEQGYSYQQLLEEARRRDSCQLLQDPELEIRRIGETLGYLNPANFTRAFKGWTGLSPREWRKRYAGG